MTPDAILNAAQASGIVVKAFGTAMANSYAKSAMQLEQGQVNLRIQQEQLASTQQAQLATRQLRENLGTQAVLAATRGVRTGVGNALTAQNTSIGNYNQDINTLKFNQGMKAYELNFSNAMSGARYQGQKAQRALSLASDSLDTISLNELIRKKSGSPIGDSEDVNVYG